MAITLAQNFNLVLGESAMPMVSQDRGNSENVEAPTTTMSRLHFFIHKIRKLIFRPLPLRSSLRSRRRSVEVDHEVARQGHGDNSTTHTPSGTLQSNALLQETHTVAVESEPQNAIDMSLVRICLFLFLYRPDGFIQ